MTGQQRFFAGRAIPSITGAVSVERHSPESSDCGTHPGTKRYHTKAAREIPARLLYVSAPFECLFAINAAVDSLIGIRKTKGMGKLMFHRGNTSGVPASDNSRYRVGKS